MVNRKSLHYIGLVGAIALGAALRFWNLDLKPLWMDEAITALFSLGRSFNDVPLEVVFSLDRLEQLFTLKPAVACPQIARTVATQSTHPPLFFCWMHTWVNWVNWVSPGWVWALRSLPALFGVSAIAAIYSLNTRAFSPAAGLMAAGLMAVSPFAVYLSQEARHYTLPMLLTTLALLGLIQIQQDLFCRQSSPRLGVWLGWALVNSIGLYVHYFFILAFIAQLGTLLVLMYWPKANTLPNNRRNTWVAMGLAVTGVVSSFLPWMPVMLSHLSRSENRWLPAPERIAPLYQTLISWLLMVIALPVENQPLWITVSAGLVMVLFGGWLAWYVFGGLKQLWNSPKTQRATFTLASFTLWVLLEFFAIAYLLGKDITVVPRYSFVYYPSFCALLGASLVGREGEGERGSRGAGEQGSRGRKLDTSNLDGRSLSSPSFPHSPLHPFTSSPLHLFTPSSTVLLVGFLSCVFVVSNWVFQKPFQPERVAQNMNQEPAVPLMVVVGYRDYQDVALGLSFALALEKVRSESASEFAFFKQSPGFESVWQKLSQLPPARASQFNLWVVGPGIRRRDYLPQLQSQQTTCTIDRTQHYRIGVPYQLYRCN